MARLAAGKGEPVRRATNRRGTSNCSNARPGDRPFCHGRRDAGGPWHRGMHSAVAAGGDAERELAKPLICFPETAYQVSMPEQTPLLLE